MLNQLGGGRVVSREKYGSGGERGGAHRGEGGNHNPSSIRKKK